MPMKKIVSCLLCLVLAMSMSVTAFAAEGSVTKEETGSQNIDVTAKYTVSSGSDTTYSVDIQWESMTFTYTESSTKTWNPSPHTYSTTTGTGAWDKTEAKITVTNHSNASVTAAVTYTPVDGTGVTGTIENGSKTLAAGVVNKPEEADALVATLKISGKPTGTVTAEGVKVGTVTVTITK